MNQPSAVHIVIGFYDGALPNTRPMDLDAINDQTLQSFGYPVSATGTSSTKRAQLMSLPRKYVILLSP
jgi:hypothetical protein